MRSVLAVVLPAVIMIVVALVAGREEPSPGLPKVPPLEAPSDDDDGPKSGEENGDAALPEDDGDAAVPEEPVRVSPNASTRESAPSCDWILRTIEPMPTPSRGVSSSPRR